MDRVGTSRPQWLMREKEIANMDSEEQSDDDDDMGRGESSIRIGDTVCFRSTDRIMYINLDDESRGVKWNGESESCLFTIYPAVGQPCKSQRGNRHVIHDGDVVCLFAPNGYFLSFDGGRLAADRPYYVAGPSAEFIVHVAGDGMLRDGGKIFFRNRANLQPLEVDVNDSPETEESSVRFPSIDGDLAQVADAAETGCFFVQKVLDKQSQSPTTPPRKRRSFSGKLRNRLVLPKLPRYARRWSQECSYLCKPAHRKLTMRSVLTQAAVAVP